MIGRAFITMLTVAAVAAGVLAVGVRANLAYPRQFVWTDPWGQTWSIRTSPDLGFLMIMWESVGPWSALTRSYDSWRAEAITPGPSHSGAQEQFPPQLLGSSQHQFAGWTLFCRRWVVFAQPQGPWSFGQPDWEAKRKAYLLFAPVRDLTTVFWILAAMFAVYPAWALMFGPVRRWRRRRRGLCVGCGYNLTGNVSGVCPECGRRR